MADKAIHFGQFVRWGRVKKRLSLRAFGALVGVGEKRMWQIEQQPEPTVYDKTKAGIAQALGIEPEKFDQAWRSTPVPLPQGRERDESKPRGVRFELSPDNHGLLSDYAKSIGVSAAEAARLLTLKGLQEAVELVRSRGGVDPTTATAERGSQSSRIDGSSTPGEGDAAGHPGGHSASRTGGQARRRKRTAG